jgi:hypothetical protein
VENTMSKRKILIYALFLLSIFISADSIYSQDLISTSVNLLERLKAISELKLDGIQLDLKFSQPVDHNNPDAGYFEQSIFLRHKNFDRPVVLVTAGYAARPNSINELTNLLDANQIIVEHRYFGKSLPDTMDYQYLDIRQAAADHHRIASAFKKIYQGKWVATGISKGGQTAMYYKRFYPDDVDMTVCYVAPLNFSDEEPRVYRFLDNVGDADCRAHIYDFQKLLLQKKSELLPLFKQYCSEKKYQFQIGIEKAFEYCVLEYSFAFWQWQKESCKTIPSATDELYKIFDHFMTVSSPHYFADSGIKLYQPFFHQALNEIGYYGYDLDLFEGLLTQVTDRKFTFCAPPGTIPEFNPDVMQDINEWLQHSGNNMIYIYGEYDPWSASAVELTGQTNSIVITKDGGSHTTRIKDLSEEDTNIIYSKIKEWMDVEIGR